MKKIQFILLAPLLSIFIYNPYGSNIFELPKIQFLSIIIALITIFQVYQYFITEKVKIPINKATYSVVGLWIISLVLSTIFSIAPQVSLWGGYDRVQGLISNLVYIVYFINFLNFFKTKQNQVVFLKFLVSLSVIASVHAILQRFGILIYSQSIMDQYMGRSFATLGHPNFLGQFLIFPIFASIYFVLQGEFKKIPPILSTILLIIALALTQNRASILGVLAGASILILIKLKIKNLYKFLIIFLGIILAGTLIFLLAPSLRSLTARFYIWKSTLKIIMDNPVIGSGLETFVYVFQKAVTPNIFSVEELYVVADHAHNEFLDIFVMQGIIGVITYLIIIISIFWTFIKNINKYKNNNILVTSIAAFTGILISNLFAFSVVINYFLISALLALILQNMVKFKLINIKKSFTTLILIIGMFIISILLLLNAYTKIYADILYKKGDVLTLTDDIEAGFILMDRATKLNPNQSKIYNTLVTLDQIIGKTLKSDNFLKKSSYYNELAGEFNNYDYEYFLNKGKLLSLYNDYSNSEIAFLKAKELAPLSPNVSTKFADMYYKSEQYEKCIEVLENFLSNVPPYWKWKNELDEKSFEEQEKLRLFIKNAPTFWSLFPNLSDSYLKTGNIKMAEYYASFIE